MAGQDPNAAMAEEDPNAAPMDPNAAAMAGQDPNMAAAGAAPVAPGMPRKQIQMLPDGTMNINIYE
jgi:hypothetical protein